MIHQFSKLDLKFGEFKVGQTFKSRIVIYNDDFQKYISFAKTRNILHEKPELAAKEGIKGTLLPGRAIIARAEGEMTRLDIFSDSIMLLYGMDGDPNWDNRHTRFWVKYMQVTNSKWNIMSRIKEKEVQKATVFYQLIFELDG